MWESAGSIDSTYPDGTVSIGISNTVPYAPGLAGYSPWYGYGPRPGWNSPGWGAPDWGGSPTGITPHGTPERVQTRVPSSPTDSAEKAQVFRGEIGG